jgi:hypothetical protein
MHESIQRVQCIVATLLNCTAAWASSSCRPGIPEVVNARVVHMKYGRVRNYGHVIPALQREAAEQMDALLSG